MIPPEEFSEFAERLRLLFHGPYPQEGELDHLGIAHSKFDIYIYVDPQATDAIAGVISTDAVRLDLAKNSLPVADQKHQLGLLVEEFEHARTELEKFYTLRIDQVRLSHPPHHLLLLKVLAVG